MEKILPQKAIKAAMDATRGNGILALACGNDDENTIGFLQSNGYFAVVRQRHERDIFGNAKTIAQNLREAVPAKTKDNFSQINSKTFSFFAKFTCALL